MLFNCIKKRTMLNLVQVRKFKGNFQELNYITKEMNFMTFTKTNMQYRVAFDTTSNRFMAIDAQNENNVAFGITIEQAVRALNESR